MMLFDNAKGGSRFRVTHANDLANSLWLACCCELDHSFAVRGANMDVWRPMFPWR